RKSASSGTVAGEVVAESGQDANRPAETNPKTANPQLPMSSNPTDQVEPTNETLTERVKQLEKRLAQLEQAIGINAEWERWRPILEQAKRIWEAEQVEHNDDSSEYARRQWEEAQRQWAREEIARRDRERSRRMMAGHGVLGQQWISEE